MKKFLLGTVGLLALGLAPASAADLAARPYTKAPPMVAAIYDWSGFYIGANGGWGSSRNCWDFTTPAGAFVANEGCHDATVARSVARSAIAGRPIAGCSALKLRATGPTCTAAMSALPSLHFANDTRLDSFGLFTGQIGYAWDATLLYVKGGAAVTSNRYRSLRYRDRPPG